MVERRLRAWLRGLGFRYDEKRREWIDPSGKYFVDDVFYNHEGGIDVQTRPLGDLTE